MKKNKTICHFCDIQSDVVKELNIGNQRVNVCMGSDGTIHSMSANVNKYRNTTIYSFEITKDVYKVHISGMTVADGFFLDGRLQYKAAGFYVRDIPQIPTDLTAESQKLKKVLQNSGYPSEKIDSEIEAAQEKLRGYVEWFENTNYSYSSLCYSQMTNNYTECELLVPHELFDEKSSSKVYLYVASRSVPKVQACLYPKDVPYFYEDPVAESVNEGNSLLGSRILLGEAYMGGKKLNGFYMWANPLTKAQSNGKDSTTYKAYFCVVSKVSELKKVEDLFKKRLLKAPNDVRKSSKSVVEKRLLEYVVKTLKLGVFEYDQEIMVYPKDTSPFYSFVWDTNSIAWKGYVETEETQNKIHHEFKNLYDCFGLNGIYTSMFSFSAISANTAAKKITRALLQQPKGKRCISIDGFLRQLMGAAIYEGGSDDNVMERKNNNNVNNIPSQINKDRRLFRDYLYSMIYSDSKEEYSGEGFFFYDSPIHYNKPKYDLGSEISPDLAEALIKTDEANPSAHAFVGKVIEYWGKRKHYHDILCNCLNIGDPDNRKDKRPTSGCHAIKKLMQDIFKAVDRYKIDIDYVYADIEQITNTAWPLRTNHRLELEETYLYDLDLYKVNGQISCDKMWNAAFSSKRFKKEIAPKLKARGFFFDADGMPCWSYVKNSFWDVEPTQRPSLGYWRCDTYAQRRQINIWDCVMDEYFAGLLQKYVYAPIRAYNPRVKYSANHVTAAKAYVSYGREIKFEPYLGGNVDLGNQMCSSVPLYGGDISKGHCKFNLDDYRCFVDDESGFAKFKNEINTLRMATASTSTGVMPFYACRYFCGDMDGFYRESLIHFWLCNPNQMIAYLNYDEDYGLKSDVEDAKRLYFRSCYQETQNVLDELNKFITKPIEKVLTPNLVNENEDFVISGVQVGNKNIWRLTQKDPIRMGPELMILLPSKTRRISFITNGKNIVFHGKIEGVHIEKERKHGAWIVTSKTCFPEISACKNFFEYRPSYETDKPRLEDNLLFKPFADKFTWQRTFTHMRGVQVFGECAPHQIWETHICFNNPKNSEIFKASDASMLGLEVGKWYTIRAVADYPDMNALEQGKLKTGDVKYYCKADGESEFKEVFSGNADFENGLYKIVENVHIGEYGEAVADSFKVFIAGKNIRTDLFRESDGVNITRVNKSLDDYKNTGLVDTKVSDKVMAKISWLNASDEDEIYTVRVYQYIINKKKRGIVQTLENRLLAKKFELLKEKVNVGAGMQDYKISALAAMKPFVYCILETEIRDKNNQVVFVNRVLPRQ